MTKNKYIIQVRKLREPDETAPCNDCMMRGMQICQCPKVLGNFIEDRILFEGQMHPDTTVEVLEHLYREELKNRDNAKKSTDTNG